SAVNCSIDVIFGPNMHTPASPSASLAASQSGRVVPTNPGSSVAAMVLASDDSVLNFNALAYRTAVLGDSNENGYLSSAHATGREGTGRFPRSGCFCGGTWRLTLLIE